ncbi:MAG: S41 family peptidase [Gammaproteobacteria bacterium]|nr:S41 family peptidase [Gammaproteobacteria bacterium]
MILRPLVHFGVLVSIVTGMALGVIAYRAISGAGPLAKQLMGEAVHQIKANYVEEVTDEQLANDAVRGMLRGLDRHSRYLDRDAFARLQADADGWFSGIGVELALTGGYFTIKATLDGSPARQAGLLPGDRITAIDGASLKGKRLQWVASSLRGPPSAPVRLRVRRGGEQFDLDLARALIAAPSVRWRWLEAGYAYARITRFNKRTGSEFEDALDTLSAARPITGLVLDVRGNSGGILPASVEVAGALLHGGVVTTMRSRPTAPSQTYRAPPGDALSGAPVVVLIDGKAASASEIVAGALQDHGRAILLGDTSFGKGTVQSLVPLSGAQGLKLTTGHYFTPSGNSIHDAGIRPDVEADPTDSEALLAQAVELLKAPLAVKASPQVELD